jgi:hypothetical protein
MKRKNYLLLAGCLFSVVLLTSLTSISLAEPKKVTGPPAQANIPEYAAAEPSKIYVLNPEGIQPEIQCYPMAPRPETLTGKTIYVVDVKYPSTTNFGNELMALLKATYPEVNWVYRQKYGTYFQDDPALWAEIKAQAAGMIIFVGH